MDSELQMALQMADTDTDLLSLGRQTLAGWHVASLPLERFITDGITYVCSNVMHPGTWYARDPRCGPTMRCDAMHHAMPAADEAQAAEAGCPRDAQ